MNSLTNAPLQTVYYDQAMLDELKDWMLFGHFYISNWRILHIDGLEGGYPPLPASRGKEIYFTFTETAK